MKKIVINFSHPLNADAEKELTRMTHCDEIVRLPVQIDFDHSFKSQIENLLEQVDKILDGNILQAIIPPGLSVVACLIVMHLAYSEATLYPVPPPLVVMENVATVGRKFMPTEILASSLEKK